MPVSAIVLIECRPGAAAGVAAALLGLRGVRVSRAVTGAYDVIARVEVRDVAALGRLVGTRVHRVPHVQTSTTVLVLT